MAKYAGKGADLYGVIDVWLDGGLTYKRNLSQRYTPYGTKVSVT